MDSRYKVQDVCHCEDDETLLIVTSKYDNFEVRNVHRKVLDDETLKTIGICKRKFLLGQTTGVRSKFSRRRISREIQRFSDILQGDFIDTYRNLTYKTLTSFLWHSELEMRRNFSIEYIIKTDDDLKVNWEDFFHSLCRHRIRRTASPQFYCHIVLKSRTPTRSFEKHDRRL